MMTDNNEKKASSSMQSSSAFGPKTALRLAPKKPNEEEERKAAKVAEEMSFQRRVGDVEESPVRRSSLIPAPNKALVSDGTGKYSLKDWLSAYEKRLAEGVVLNRPSEGYKNIEKDRFAQIMPAYISAALTTVAKANGFNKEWELIEHMLQELGVFEDK